MLNTSIRFNAIDHYHFCGLNNDTMVSKELLSGKIYQSYIWNFIKKNIKQGQNIIDIGANIGGFTVLIADLVKNGMVYAFEPQRIIFQILCTNIILNKLDNVYTYEVALGASEKYGYLGTTKNTNYSYDDIVSFAPIQITNIETSHKICIVPLDNFNFKNISLIKIDVGDYSEETLNGCIKTIINNKPLIIFEDEYNKRKNIKRKKLCNPLIEKLFETLNYNIILIEHSDYLAFPKERDDIVL